jgi:hypothetical protein
VHKGDLGDTQAHKYSDEGDMEEQLKSRQRVADHGEVFTSLREVNAMLDLVKQETERIESRLHRELGSFVVNTFR